LNNIYTHKGFVENMIINNVLKFKVVILISNLPGSRHNVDKYETSAGEHENDDFLIFSTDLK
jgi:hypothetical protein